MNVTDLNEYFGKVRDGDKEAFEKIYNELKIPVFTIVYRILLSRESAEDVTQDIFIKLFLSPPDPSVKNPRAWIFSMARNLAIDTLRKKQCDSIDFSEREIADEYYDIADRLDLDEALRKLTAEEREVLSLHIDIEMRFSDISKLTGASLPSVYRRYRSALKKLRIYLSGGTL